MNFETLNTNVINTNNCYVSKDFSAIIPFCNFFDFSNNLTTTITNNNFTLLNCDTTIGFSNSSDLLVENNKITNKGKKRIFFLDGIASVSSSNNKEIHFAFFKNGVLWPCSEQSVITGPGGRAGSCPFSCLIELDTDDYIQVYTKNSTSNNDIVLDNINVICRSFT